MLLVTSIFSFYQCFLRREIIILTFNFSSAKSFNLVMSKILSFGKGLNTITNTISILLLLVNSLSDDKFLDWSYLKAFADKKVNVIEKLKFVSQRIENMVGKKKMLVTTIFSFFHNVSKSLLCQGR